MFLPTIVLLPMDVINQQFDWKTEEKKLAWFDDGTLNVAHNAIDQHLTNGNAQKIALIYEYEKDETSTFTFEDLAKKSNKVANLLKKNVVNKGDRVFLFLPRTPDLFISFIGIVKTGAIAGTMFSAFGPDALKDRLENSKAKALFTTKELLPRVEQVRSQLPDLEHIFIVDDENYKNDLESSDDSFEVFHTKPEDYAFMLYTSGTTGK